MYIPVEIKIIVPRHPATAPIIILVGYTFTSMFGKDICKNRKNIYKVWSTTHPCVR